MHCIAYAHHKFCLGWVPAGMIVPDSMGVITRIPAGYGNGPTLQLTNGTGLGAAWFPGRTECFGWIPVVLINFFKPLDFYRGIQVRHWQLTIKCIGRIKGFCEFYESPDEAQRVGEGKMNTERGKRVEEGGVT